MRKDFDLHIHTTASEDGEYPPQQIFKMAKAAGLCAIAFTDHDSVANVREGLTLSKKHSIEFLPAVEITTIYKNYDLHLLGYLLDYEKPEFLETLAFIENKRIEQSAGRVKRLQELGFKLEFEDVKSRTKGKVPTTLSIFRALTENGLNTGDERLVTYLTGKRSRSPIFNFYRDYFCKGKPAHVPCRTVATPRAIEIVLASGGVPVLAHPGRTPFTLLDGLLRSGLPGIEVYSSSHDKKTTEKLFQYARKNNLLITSGTDYHGPNIKPDVEFGALIEDHYEYVLALKRWRRRAII